VVKKKRGGDYLKNRKTQTELNRINGELNRLKRQTAALEKRRSRLMAGLAKG
jgi:predicted  nucleic acid-binding Zn-ribbon protein